jgi:hypothetical protein
METHRQFPCSPAIIPSAAPAGADDWPEKGQRETRRLDPAEAAALVN